MRPLLEVRRGIEPLHNCFAILRCGELDALTCFILHFGNAKCNKENDEDYEIAGRTNAFKHRECAGNVDQGIKMIGVPMEH